MKKSIDTILLFLILYVTGQSVFTVILAIGFQDERFLIMNTIFNLCFFLATLIYPHD